MISKVNLSKATSILIIALVFYSCSSISVFSPEAYKQAVDLKVESLESYVLRNNALCRL